MTSKINKKIFSLIRAGYLEAHALGISVGRCDFSNQEGDVIILKLKGNNLPSITKFFGLMAYDRLCDSLSNENKAGVTFLKNPLSADTVQQTGLAPEESPYEPTYLY